MRHEKGRTGPVKRFVVMLAAIAALVVPMASVSAGAFTQTTHFSSFSDFIPGSCAGLFSSGAIIVNGTNGNGVQHITVDGAGDSWFTVTFTGQGTLTFIPGETFQGHLTEWFGAETNARNSVSHAILSFGGTNVTDASQSLQAEIHFDLTLNANGQVVATP